MMDLLQRRKNGEIGSDWTKLVQIGLPSLKEEDWTDFIGRIRLDIDNIGLRFNRRLDKTR